jgi:hypothetical protein
MYQVIKSIALSGRFSQMVLCVAGMLCFGPAEAATPGVGPAASGAQVETVVHKLSLSDPVFPSEPPRVYRVSQTKDSHGFPVGYALSMKTHVCIDKKCKTVEATLHWNGLGYYDRFEHPPGKPLTKKEHVPFLPEDYAKLDQILKDRSSILGRHSLAYLSKPVAKDEVVDGWSGATPATVQQSVIKDAAYTTWVMWRWANGEIVPKLRRITEQSCTPAYLQHLLSSQDRRSVDFALKYAVERHSADEQLADSVFHVLETGDREHVALSLRFLSSAVKDKTQLHARLIDSCCRMKSIYCPMVLTHLAAEPDLPATTLDGLTEQLDRLPYFPVHLILRLLEEREFFSEKTESDVSRLLGSDNFFVARRASEFLLKQPLSRETRSKVNAFRERNRDRL